MHLFSFRKLFCDFTHRLVRATWGPWALYHETTVHTLLSMCACVHTHVHTMYIFSVPDFHVSAAVGGQSTDA